METHSLVGEEGQMLVEIVRSCFAMRDHVLELVRFERLLEELCRDFL